MLAICSMLHPTNYAKNYAGIMGAGLVPIINLGGVHKLFFLAKW